MNNSIKKNKTGMSINMIIGIIITIFTLVLLLFFINTQMKQAQYSQSIIGCNLLFSNIDGKPTYFSGSLNTTNNKLIDEIAKQGINSSLVLVGLVGTIVFIGSLIAIFKKFF